MKWKEVDVAVAINFRVFENEKHYELSKLNSSRSRKEGNTKILLVPIAIPNRDKKSWVEV